MQRAQTTSCGNAYSIKRKKSEKNNMEKPNSETQLILGGRVYQSVANSARYQDLVLGTWCQVILITKMVPKQKNTDLFTTVEPH